MSDRGMAKSSSSSAISALATYTEHHQYSLTPLMWMPLTDTSACTGIPQICKVEFGVQASSRRRSKPLNKRKGIALELLRKLIHSKIRPSYKLPCASRSREKDLWCQKCRMKLKVVRMQESFERRQRYAAPKPHFLSAFPIGDHW